LKIALSRSGEEKGLLIRCNLALWQSCQPEVLLKLLLLVPEGLLLLLDKLIWSLLLLLLLLSLSSGKHISELVWIEEGVNPVDEGLEECSIPLRFCYPSFCRWLLS